MISLIRILGLTLLGFSCIDRVSITVPNSNGSQLVVDGVITDEPGPYTVKLSLSSSIEGFLRFRKLVSAKRVTLFDDAGNSEEFKEIEEGTYQTRPDGIRGQVGHEYYVRIEMLDGKVYETIPDKMNPAGEIDSLYYQLESFQPIDAPTRYDFRVFIDAHGVPNGDNLFRWKFIGTYQIESYPLLHKESDCAPNPRPCGVRDVSHGCTCCTCWVNQYENRPFTSDNQLVSNEVFKKIEVAYVPIDYIPFQIKYRMEVRQMSLSRTAFDYWKIIQSQKEGGSSLFQPPTGKTRTNVYEKTGVSEAQGIFYASSIKLRQVFVSNKEVRGLFLKIPRVSYCAPFGIIEEDCRLAFPYSSSIKPTDWK